MSAARHMLEQLSPPAEMMHTLLKLARSLRPLGLEREQRRAMLSESRREAERLKAEQAGESATKAFEKETGITGIARRWLNCCEVPTTSQRFHGTSPAHELRRGEHVLKYYARVNAAERRLQRTLVGPERISRVDPPVLHRVWLVDQFRCCRRGCCSGT